MSFIKQTEATFKKLQYAVAIDPCLNFEYEGENYSIELDFFDYEVQEEFENSDAPYDYKYKHDIHLLEILRKKEYISIDDALKHVENLKDEYWFQLRPESKAKYIFEGSNEKIILSDFIFEEIVKKVSNSNEPILNVSKLKKIYNSFRSQYAEKRETIFQEIVKVLKSEGKESVSNFDGLPEPLEIAKEFYSQNTNKRKEYKPDEIAPVMKKTREFIIKNEITDTLWGKVNGIHKVCEEMGLPGKDESHRNWITFYAKRAGLKGK